QIVPPVRRRARLGLLRPQNPSLPARIGFRERFRHDLVDLQECPVLEPLLFTFVGNLRRVVRDMLPPGGAGEVMLSRTDSGVDMLIEAAEAPALGALEALAAFAEECDPTRIVWRSRAQDTVVVERRPVRVLLSGVTVAFPPGAFLQASEAAES